MSAGRPARHEAGFALVAVLIAGGFLALLAAGMARAAHTEGAVTRNFALAAAARAAADGAVRAAIFDLLSEDAAGLPRDGSTRHADVADIPVAISIQDAAGLVDLNTAAPELLGALFLEQSASPPLAAALTTEVLRRRPTPRSAGAPAAGLPFLSVTELAATAGMTPELYRRLAPLVTVQSRQTGIDPRTAPAAILLALPGADARGVLALLATRADSPVAARALLPATARFFIDSTRDAVRITATANASGVIAGRSAIVRLMRGARPPYRILDWQPSPA